MRSVSVFLLFALSAVVVNATNITGDPTDLANWPPCAVCVIPSFVSDADMNCQLRALASSKNASPLASRLQSRAMVSQT